MSPHRRPARTALTDLVLRSGASRSHRGRGRRGRSGFGMWGPFPTYSRRTRGGAHVRVGGCCLPIPLTFAVAAATALAYGVRRAA